MEPEPADAAPPACGAGAGGAAAPAGGEGTAEGLLCRLNSTARTFLLLHDYQARARPRHITYITR